MNDLQQAAQTARSMLMRVGGDGGVLHQIEAGERTAREDEVVDLLALIHALAERVRLDRTLIDRFTE